jgi:hypothetical protein
MNQGINFRVDRREAAMTIQFMEPLSRAWDRMKTALFKPFDLHKWFVVGFNAFLAGLMEAWNGGGGSRFSKRGDLREIIHFPRTAWAWLMAHQLWASLILVGLLAAIAIAVVLTWVSARGTFMFMDNVVKNSAEVAKPWREYEKEGNSLFVWRLLLGFAAFLTFGAVITLFFIQGAALYGTGFRNVLPLGFMLGMGLLMLALAVIWGYVNLFLRDFVAALMYRDRISCGQAWKVFLRLFGKSPFHFIGYGVLIFLFIIAFVIAVVIAGLATCCIGFFLLVIPYISTVLTLPVWYTYRAFSLEFLAQFGPDYDAFRRQEPGPAATPAVPTATAA